MTNKYRVIFRYKRDWKLAYGTEVDAREECSAISSARFQLKRNIGFNVDWIDWQPRHLGLHFLHEYDWDVQLTKMN